MDKTECIKQIKEFLEVNKANIKFTLTTINNHIALDGDKTYGAISFDKLVGKFFYYQNIKLPISNFICGYGIARSIEKYVETLKTDEQLEKFKTKERVNSFFFNKKEINLEKLLPQIAYRKAKDNIFRDAAAIIKIMLSGDFRALTLSKCETIDDYFKVFKMIPSCMQIGDSNTSYGEINKYFKTHKMHPCLFYYYCPYIDVYSLQFYDKVLGRVNIYNKTHYGSLYCTSGLHNHFKLELNKLGYTDLKGTFQPKEIWLFKGIRIDNQRLFPLAFCDNMCDSISIAYDKKKNLFIVFPGVNKEGTTIGSHYTYSGFVKSDNVKSIDYNQVQEIAQCL